MFVEEKAKGEVKELDEASKLLLKAATLIEERGWCRGRLEDDDGKLCVEGAINMAYHGDFTNVFGTVVTEARQRLNIALGVEYPSTWNNHKARDKEEVIAKLRAVAFSS